MNALPPAQQPHVVPRDWQARIAALEKSPAEDPQLIIQECLRYARELDAALIDLFCVTEAQVAKLPRQTDALCVGEARVWIKQMAQLVEKRTGKSRRSRKMIKR